MNQQTFLITLGAITLLLGILFNSIGYLANCQGISMVFLAVFTFISVSMYMLGVSAANSSNKNTFINLIMLSVLAKMLFSLITLFIYNKRFHPSDKSFLIPFFICYLVYTVFETYFMIKVGKEKAKI